MSKRAVHCHVNSEYLMLSALSGVITSNFVIFSILITAYIVKCAFENSKE